MRVLYVVKTNDGAFWAFEQAKKLKELGIDIIAVLPFANGGYAENYKQCGINVIAADLSLPILRPWQLFSRIKLIKNLINQIKPDLIHCHFVTNIMMIRLALHKKGPPRIFQLPGPLHLEHFLYRKLEILLSDSRDFWAGSCKKSCEYYLREGIARERVFLCYYGGYGDKAEKYAPAQGRLHKQYNLPSESRLIGMIAYFYKPKYHLFQFRGIKGHEDFIKAISIVLKKHSDVRAFIIGGVWKNSHKYMSRVIKTAKRQCGDNIIFTGHKNDLTDIYRELEIAVHPSISENLGGAAESLAAGVPTIATDVGGFPDIIKDFKTGLLTPPHNPEKLTDKIEYLLENRQLASEMAAKGQTLVRQKLSLDRCADDVLSMYKTVAVKDKPLSYQPLVSIIIPVYNGAEFLSQAINSALSQTYPYIEVIVVNDGSCDGGATRKQALNFGEKIKYIEKANGGVSSALNTGIANMNGQWFSWLSHDDLYNPQKIERQIKLLNLLSQCDREINLDKTVIYCDTELIDKSGKVVYKLKPIKHQSNIELILRNIKNNRFSGCSFLIPRAGFNDIGLFNEEIRTVSDYEYWYRLLLNDYEFHHLPEFLVQGRIHKGQVTHKKQALSLKELDNFYLWLIEQLYIRPQYKNAVNFIKAGSYAQRRRLLKSSNKAFQYAKELAKNPIFQLCCPLVVFYNELIFHLRHLFKSVFLKVIFYRNRD